MRARLLTVLIAALSTGCYASHERVDVALCAPPGVHSVESQVMSTEECGLIGSGPMDVTIPPTAEMFFGTPGVGEVVEVGPCRWEVHGTEASPDLSFSVDGFIDTSDGTVRGEFDVEVTGIGGLCVAHLEWTEVE
jgi:hypothetical protein